MIFIKLVQHIKDMMAVAVKKFHNCLLFNFLIIRQNVKMATNVEMHWGVCPRRVGKLDCG